jgi:sterol desaturase/sphingolipid hydroxylase (fatty acid hydroxylase superfamily)
MQHLAAFALEVFKLALWLGVLAAVFVPLERAFALRPAKAWRAGLATDLAYYFLSSLLPAALMALPLALLTAAGHKLMPAAWLHEIASLPFAARFTVALVVGEIGAYWGHRWSHEIPCLWRFHALHHSAAHMDWLVHTRAHPVDMVFVRLCSLAPLAFFGLLPAAGGAKLALGVAIATTFWGFFVHANLRWRLGPFEYLLATPAFHHWHHSRTEPINRNYATTLPCLDLLFGSFHLPRHWPGAYGIDPPVPDGLGEQLMAPLAPTRSLQPMSTPPGAASQPPRGAGLTRSRPACRRHAPSRRRPCS